MGAIAIASIILLLLAGFNAVTTNLYSERSVKCATTDLGMAKCLLVEGDALAGAGGERSTAGLWVDRQLWSAPSSDDGVL